MATKNDLHAPKSLELSEGQMEVHFRRLNLAHMRRIYKEVAERAEKESWAYRDFLALLLAEEVARRKQTRLQRCTRHAHFPFFKTIEEFDFTLQSILRQSLLGSYLGPDFVTEGRSLILHGKTGRGKTHLAVAIGYRAIQNGFETLFTTAAELIEDLSNASKRGHLQESLSTYTHPHVLVIDEVGYLTYGPDAANVLFHVVNDRHLRKRPMLFTTNKPMTEWGKVLHDEDMAAAILDRVLERGRFIHLDGPSGRTRHLNLEESLPANTKELRISGIGGSEFPEPTREFFELAWTNAETPYARVHERSFWCRILGTRRPTFGAKSIPWTRVRIEQFFAPLGTMSRFAPALRFLKGPRVPPLVRRYHNRIGHMGRAVYRLARIPRLVWTRAEVRLRSEISGVWWRRSSKSGT